LLETIATDPAIWSNVSKVLRSEALYKESFICLVGQWHERREEERKVELLDDRTVELVQEEYSYLLLLQQAVYREILRHVIAMEHVPEQLRQILQKPNTDTALSYETRQELLNRHHTQYLKTRMYREILHYHIDPEVIYKEIFNAYRKNHADIVSNIQVMVLEMKKKVKPLLESSLQLTQNSFKGDYLTCAVLKPNSYPWETQG
jgi:hypothetical protein